MVYFCTKICSTWFRDEIPFLLLIDGERVTHFEEGDAGIAKYAKRAHRKIHKRDI